MDGTACALQRYYPLYTELDRRGARLSPPPSGGFNIRSFC